MTRPVSGPICNRNGSTVEVVACNGFRNEAVPHGITEYYVYSVVERRYVDWYHLDIYMHVAPHISVFIQSGVDRNPYTGQSEFYTCNHTAVGHFLETWWC